MAHIMLRVLICIALLMPVRGVWASPPPHCPDGDVDCNNEELFQIWRTFMEETGISEVGSKSWSRFPHNPNLGKVKVLVLLIQFEDHQYDRTLIDKEVIEEFWRGPVMEWFETNAMGLFEIEPVVIDWVTTDNTEAYYSFGQSGFVRALQYAMHPALDQVDEQLSGNWSQFDVNGDGMLDSVIMMHSGISAANGLRDCFGQSIENLIWDHGM